MTNSWEAAYSSKSPAERSWTQEHPGESLGFIDGMHLDTSAPVVDVGGGSSSLVDELLLRGFEDITVVDISATAIAEARARIADLQSGRGTAGGVTWITGDIAGWSPSQQFALWHDRAVFHFLVDEDARAAYVAKAATHVASGGHLLIATFAEDGPEMCSGLPVHRWNADDLGAEFAGSFHAVASARIEHVTPWGSVQPFTWLHLVHR